VVESHFAPRGTNSFSGDGSSISSNIGGTVLGGSTNFLPLWVIAYERLRSITNLNES